MGKNVCILFANFVDIACSLIYSCTLHYIFLYPPFLGHHFIPCECDGFYDPETADDVTCSNLFLKNEEKFYSLHDQIDHKLAFVYNYLPPDSKLILIGHSVGAYIILEIMRRLHPSDRIVKCILLFPTIERITKTSSGKFWTTVAYFMTKPLLWLIWLFNAMPLRFQLWFIRCCMVLRRFCNEDNLTGATFSFVNHHGVSNMLQIASDMKSIQDLDAKIIDDNKEKIVLYYGKEDPWVPASFCQQMTEKFPSVDIRLCKENHKHAFVLYTAKDVGQLVWSFIKDSWDSWAPPGQPTISAKSPWNTQLLNNRL